MRPVRASLLTRLLVGFMLGGLLVSAILMFGDRVLRDSATRLEAIVADHVRPLAATHRLQSRIDGLRALELELPQIRDYFAVVLHLTRMQTEIQVLADELKPFAAQLAIRSPQESTQLTDHWNLYRSDLENIIERAKASDMAGAANISSTQSHLAYGAISAVLRDLVSSTEASAEVAFLRAQEEHQRQQRFFVGLSFAGLLFLASGLLLFARSLSQRLRTLRDAAARLAAGETQGSISIAGADEIADLGRAFDAMQDKVLARERALREAQDILEERVHERTRELQASNEQLHLLSQAVEQSPVGVMIADAEGNVEYVNAAYLRDTGFTRSESLGLNVLRSWSALGGDDSLASLRTSMVSGREWSGEFVSLRHDGASYWEHVHFAPVVGAGGSPRHLLLIRENISLRKEHEQKIIFQAHFDGLSGLPNRNLAMDRLAQTIGHAHREGRKAAVMFIDLDNFKQINDTLGHDAGDTLLRAASVRLREAVRDDDTVARLGGDEFLVVMGGLANPDDANRVAGKIIQAFEAPFDIVGRELTVSPSIGLAIYPDDGLDPATLLRNSDLAMYDAKDAGRNTYRFFNQAIHDLSVERLEVERCLRSALPRGEMRVYFQPLVASADSRLIGAEALLRWESADFGWVPPDRFIPIAEQSGLIVSIGEWVLRQACLQAGRWRRLYPDFRLTVNVSPQQFRISGFADMVQNCLDESGFSPSCLELEVTEGLLMRNQGEVRTILSQLETMGVSLAMDDFGTGYSSLSYLREFPFSTVKIDRAFVSDLSDNPDDRALVIAAIRMARALGLTTIAEGVETRQQRDFLAANDCDILQGYMFGRPIPPADFEQAWLRGMSEPNPVAV